MTKAFEGIQDAATAVRRWLIQHEKDYPAHLQAQLTQLQGEPSPVVVAMRFAEAVYANPDEFKADAKELAAACAVVGETFGFHGMADDNRGSLISRALSGEKVAKDKLPKPDATLQPPPSEDGKSEPAED